MSKGVAAWGPTVFAHCSRTGGSSVGQALATSELPYRKLEGNLALNLKYCPVPWETYRLITVVRHPLERLVSLVAKIVKFKDDQLPPSMFERFVRDGFRRPNGTVPTVHTDGPNCWDMGAPICDCLRGYQPEVYRFETLGTTFPLPLPHWGASRHLPWQDYYQDGMIRDAVVTRYAEDLRIYGYE